MKRRISQYRGKLSIEVAIKGIQAVDKNAKALLKEATLLFRNKHWARACALAILAIEEHEKIFIIEQILLQDDEKGLIKLWKSFRTHYEKNLFWVSINLDEKVHDWEGVVAYIKEMEEGKFIEEVKQLTLYSDAIGENCEWITPSEDIPKVLATEMVKVARHQVERRLGKLFSKKGLTLYIEQLTSTNRGTTREKIEAIISFFYQAERRGLIGVGEAKDSEDHLRKKLHMD
jgi:AbiV family abortive infection protein